MRCDTVDLCGADGELKAQLDKPLDVLMLGTSVVPQFPHIR